MANLQIKVPCVHVPKIPKIPNVNLMGMVDLKGFLDFSVGSPKDCTLSINLMLQLAPLLASMSCLLKMLAVIKALEGAVTSGMTKTGDLLDAIAKLADCFLVLAPPKIFLTIKGILELIISFFGCFIEQLESLITFQASIDLNSAAGNPVLLQSLECARENAQNSMDNLMLSLESVQPLLEMTSALGQVVGFDLKLPGLSGVSAQKDGSKSIANLKQTIEMLRAAVKGLPS